MSTNIKILIYFEKHITLIGCLVVSRVLAEISNKFYNFEGFKILSISKIEFRKSTEGRMNW